MTDSLQQLADEAFGHLNAGRFSDAVASFQKLLAVNPDLPDYWYNLGYAQRRARQFEEALASYAQALERMISQPEQTHLNRAVILASDLNRPEDAVAELGLALKQAPRFFPALLNLGGIFEDLGLREEAKAAYERALAVEPRDVLTLTRLAVLSDIEALDHPLVEQMRELMADPGTAATDKADLGFALGLVLDRLGAHDEAFGAYEAANAASAADRQSRHQDYVPADEAALTDRIIEAFAASGSEAGGAQGEPPIFICGMFRSGSTLAEQILAQHSRVTAGGELSLIPAIVTGFEPYPEAAAAIDDGEAARLRQRYLDELALIRPDADIVTDKQPINFRHIGLIKRLFPDARIVDTLRNPRDNCLAVWFAHLGPRVPYAVDLGNTVHWYKEYRRLMAHWQALWPESIHTLDYDALVADPEPQIRALLEFCGLEFEEACLEPHRTASSVRTASAWQVRQPLYTSSSGRWRNYEAHIAPLLEAFPAS